MTSQGFGYICDLSISHIGIVVHSLNLFLGTSLLGGIIDVADARSSLSRVNDELDGER